MTDRTFQRALDLIRREADLKASARLLELVPARAADAAWLFRRASYLRSQRLELLVRAGVLESVEPWAR